MNQKLAWALWYAGKGFRVFPLAVNAKEPAFRKANKTDPGPPQYATTDESTISNWWVNGHEYNIGVISDKHIIADLDEKLDPKTGQRRTGLADYIEAVGELDTLTTLTPSGGRHLFFKGEVVTNSGWGGVDIRSGNGYVVGAGSTLDGKPYVLERDLPVANVPERLLYRLRLAKTADKDRDQPLTELDTPAILWAAGEICRVYPIAHSGELNNTAFKLAARMRDEGVSEDAAVDVMADWAERCEPPIPYTELPGIIANAYAYAQNRPGSKSAAVAFSGIEITPAVLEGAPIGAESADSGSVNGSVWGRYGKSLVPSILLQKRPWVYRGLLMRRDVSIMVAPGGIGKSTLGLALAAHAAYGVPFLGFKPQEPNIPIRTVVYNAEDSRNEMSARMHAACAIYGFDPDIVNSSVVLVSGKDDLRFKIARKSGANVELQVEGVNDLIRELHHARAGILALDPLAKLHDSTENSNTEMSMIMDSMAAIAEKADVAMLIAHHTAKPPQSASDAYAGNSDAGRGASSIRDSARVTITLMGPRSDDSKKYGLQPNEMRKYLRLDGAKNNLTLLSDEPVWLEKRSVLQHTGDEIGVFIPVQLQNRGDEMRLSLAVSARSVLQHAGTAAMSVPNMASAICARDPIYEKAGAIETRQRIERFLSEPVRLSDGAVISVGFEKNTKVVRMG